MPDYTKDGKIVLNLKGAWFDATDYRNWTTTQNYFTRDAFLGLREGIAKLRATDDGTKALNGFIAGERLATAQTDLLKAHLGAFAENRNAVNGVADWVAEHGPTLPESVLKQSGGLHPVFPEQITAAVQALSDRLGEKAGGAIAAMRAITKGETVGEAEINIARKAFEDAGLLTIKGELTSVGTLLLQEDGARFLARAGIVTAESAGIAVRTLQIAATGVAGAGELSEVSKLARRGRVTGETGAVTEDVRIATKTLGEAARKLPVAGNVLSVASTIAAIADSAHAATLPPAPTGAPNTLEEKKAREFLEWEAQTGRQVNLVKEVIKGTLALTPLPGADIAFAKSTDSLEKTILKNMGPPPASRGPLQPERLAWKPTALDVTASQTTNFNLQARGPQSSSPPVSAPPATIPRVRPPAAP
jgi:hypothetical protein